ncbi:2-succinyl-5-enolpyruvyl-6-hydroxy-3-cyclohexene-1-carboxylic-acid synthase [Rothia aeria]|uniref:2-succinyl-5-enolpyruvyl-6-hydroxy-3-cyclohexene-1-carboxylic-acid synthase n=1 Tax=Rothia aeria TaxID=172042 RepID=A0A2Z5R394_9MICC|nr:2-succinyl-5-enolpyruvyl-6-hydroxy-3-cyclohexene-1-carboxylic-acid synthase [Rothia aeria]
MNLPLFAEPSSGARGGRTSIPHYVELLGMDARSELGAQIERVVLLGIPRSHGQSVPCWGGKASRRRTTRRVKPAGMSREHAPRKK